MDEAALSELDYEIFDEVEYAPHPTQLMVAIGPDQYESAKELEQTHANSTVEDWASMNNRGGSRQNHKVPRPRSNMTARGLGSDLIQGGSNYDTSSHHQEAEDIDTILRTPPSQLHEQLTLETIDLTKSPQTEDTPQLCDSARTVACLDLTNSSPKINQNVLQPEFPPPQTDSSPSPSKKKSCSSDEMAASQQSKPPVCLVTRRKRKNNDDTITEAVVIPKRLKSDANIPIGKPVVWAVRRQQLCEALPYYKSYQSSWYTKDGVAYAVLLADDDSARSYMDSNVIIGRGPGGRSEDPLHKGYRKRTKSHDKSNAACKAIRMACKTKASLIVIASNTCKNLPSRMPHNFQVLDYYWITNYWWEKDGDFTIFKYRLERVNLSTQPWYAPKSEQFLRPDFTVQCNAGRCSDCGRKYLQIYQDWMCLNLDCDSFCKVLDGRALREELLKFNEAFLKKRTPFQGRIAFDIKPTIFESSSHAEIQYAYSRESWLGFWCNVCGACTSREHWKWWKCSCGYQQSIKTPLLKPELTNVQFDAKGFGYPLSLQSLYSSIVPAQTIVGKYKVDIYHVNDCDRIFHFKSCPEINAKGQGPDDIFQELQLAKNMDLKRRINGNTSETNPKTMLTRHFSQNYGLHYSYVVKQDSTPFSNAPPPICRALQRLIWAGEITAMDRGKPFNEMLVVGYMASGSMGYHDDGEKELGSTVSTLSLGCDAVMCFRYKPKYWSPPLDFKTGKYTPEKQVPPGAPLERERNLMIKWAQQNPDATVAQMKAHFGTYARVRKIVSKMERAPEHPDLVQILLKHGDMCVMEGTTLQKYIEHRVEPLGCLRFALTSRHILADFVRPEELHMGDVDLSAYPAYDGAKDCMSEGKRATTSRPLEPSSSMCRHVSSGGASRSDHPGYDLVNDTSQIGYDSGMEN